MSLHAPANGDIIDASHIDQFATLLQSGVAGSLLTGQGVGSDPVMSPNIDIPGTFNVTGVAEFGSHVQLDDTLRLSTEVLTYASVVTVPASFDGVVELTTTSAGGNATLNADVTGAAGQLLYVMVHNDATAARTITFGTHFVATGPLVGTPSQTAIVAFLSDGTAFYEVGRSVQVSGGGGHTVLSGASDPASGTGSDGDFYINTTSHTIFGPKAGGAWPSGTSLIGPTGSAGPTGSTGSTGPAGADGNTVLYGSGDPASGTGVNGNFYINTTSHTLFGPKAGGAWPAGTSLVGPAGPTGPTGPVSSVSGTAPVSVATGTTTPVISVPAFVASGASHAAGLVPDPGSTAGTTKFLREDGGWAVPAGGGGSLTTASAQLGADVTMTSASTNYDGPSLSLAAGTWLVVGKATILPGSGGGDFTLKLWDGTTVYDSAGGAQTLNNQITLVVFYPIVLTSTTTIKMTAKADTGGNKIKAATNYVSENNTATTIAAVKVA